MSSFWILFFLYFYEVRLEWELTGHDSHENCRSSSKSSSSDWEVGIQNGYIFNGQLVIDNESLIYTLCQNNEDNTTSEYIVRISIDTGKENERTLIKTESTKNVDESYGGLIFSGGKGGGKYVFIKSAMKSDVHVFDLYSSTMETNSFVLPSSPLNLPFFLYDSSLIYPNFTTNCGKNTSVVFQCFHLVSRNLQTLDLDWTTSFIIPDSCRASEYALTRDDEGIIYLMTDTCGAESNEIYKISSKDGSLLKKVEIPGGTVSSASQISVSNIKNEEEELSNYYFIQKTRSDKKTYVFANSKEKDTLVWKEKITGTEFQSCSSPSLNYDGTTMSTVCPGYVTSVLYSLNAKDGKKIFTKTIFDGFCMWTSTMDNGHIAVLCDNLVFSNAMMFVFDKNGKKLEKYEHKKMTFEQFPIIDMSNSLYYCVTNYNITNCYKKSF